MRYGLIDSFLGKGFSLDFGPDSCGCMAMAGGRASVEESIRIILGTSKGERVMRPDFGCDLNSLVFAPNNSRTRSLAQYYVEEALTKWEHRIVIKGVDVRPDEVDETRFHVSIDYLLRSVNTYFNMVYPFYLERGEIDTQSQFG
ncbi:MAG: GPW/gp25 family protein [Spirochaetales bacterium]|nr:GPW/gp25 family protein [Spirochaetales bacterium]